MEFVTLVFALCGAVVASFTGVVAERIHTGQSFVRGRSKCNACRRTLTPLDLIPVLSWLASLGRCRTCHAKLPIFYIFYEATLGLLFAASFVAIGFTPMLPVFIAALAVTGLIVIYDLRHTVVPPAASTLLVVLGLLYAYGSAASLSAFGGALLTAGLVSLFFYLLHVGSGGRAMGLGDTPVALGLSLLAAPAALAGLFFSFWIGGLIGILILVRRRRGSRIGIEVPFVPFMAAGFLLAYFFPWNPLTNLL